MSHFGYAQLAHEHLNDLRRDGKTQRLVKASYPDRERTPRILRYWANR